MMIASTAIFPTPSQRNIDSIIAVPPNNEPIDNDNKVIKDNIQTFNTDLYKMTDSLIPRERAARTYSLVNSSKTIILT